MELCGIALEANKRANCENIKHYIQGGKMNFVRRANRRRSRLNSMLQSGQELVYEHLPYTICIF